MIANVIKEQLQQMPARPGVYLLLDDNKNILYVGKAINLRNRVRSYFISGQKLPHKTRLMITRVHDIDFFVTSSEQEALILELNLIKRHRPHYNVRLKDDKSFPYLKINYKEDWPRVYVTRRLEEDGSHYFGPFTDAKSIRQTLKLIKSIFPFRSCSKVITSTYSRPCLDYYIHHCLGPCIGKVNKKEYTDILKQVILFLEGKQEKIIKRLEKKMNQTAEALNFEGAAYIRDQIQGIKEVIERQRITTALKGEQDVVAFAQDEDQACAQVFFVRDGKLIGRQSFKLQGTRSEEPEQIMTSFIKQFYDSSTHIPPLLLLQYDVEDRAVIENWLQYKRGSKVRIHVPLRGSKKKIVNTATENSRHGLVQLKIKQFTTDKALTAALTEISKVLHLSQSPFRIEGYDISNIQGKAAVGSLVVFERGVPKPSQYRRFRIKTVSGADDCAMLQEVLSRRFKRSKKQDSNSVTSDKWTVLPDLVLVDGGRGQLSAVRSTMSETGVSFIPTLAIAKEREELFLPQQAEPITLPQSSLGLQLLQHIRDEAHRFALDYHRKMHKKEALVSALDSIPGLGSKRKHTLLNKFYTIQAIRKASIDELVSTCNITYSLAKKIKEYL